jgi:hypothetical protein
MGDNRFRVLTDVMSIDAWHDPFQIDGRTSAVHVEVSFQQGRLGGDDPELPFTFRIALKRALLTVHLESPLSIQRSSVARDIPQDSAELSKILSAKKVAKSAFSTKGSINPATLSLGLSGMTSSEREATREEQVKVVQQLPRIIATSRPGGANEYSWDLQPTFDQYLDGQPWDPAAEPRLKARHPSTRGKIDPVIKITLSCALEDLSITDLTPKPVGLIESVKQVLANDISYAAAVQFLKRALVSADLHVGHVDNRFSDLLIADVLAKEEDPSA